MNHSSYSSIKKSLEALGDQPWKSGEAADLLSEKIVGGQDEAGEDLAPLLFDAIRLQNNVVSELSVRTILKARPDWVDIREKESGDTPLIAAVKRGRFDVVDLLMAAGGNPSLENDDGFNALSQAANKNGNQWVQEAMINAVISGGAFTRENKSFALAIAAENMNLGGVRGLLKNGADFSASLVTSHGGGGDGVEKGNALAVACFHDDDGDSLEIVRLMIKSNKVKKALNHGWENPEFGAAIHCAAFGYSTDALKALIAAGALVNPPDDLKNQNPQTPLMVAAFTWSNESIKELLLAGADVTLVDKKGQNAGHFLSNYEGAYAENENDVWNDTKECVDLLASAGLDFGAVDSNGHTPGALARANGFKRLAVAMNKAALAAAQANLVDPDNKNGVNVSDGWHHGAKTITARRASKTTDSDVLASSMQPGQAIKPR